MEVIKEKTNNKELRSTTKFCMGQNLNQSHESDLSSKNRHLGKIAKTNHLLTNSIFSHFSSIAAVLAPISDSENYIASKGNQNYILDKIIETENSFLLSTVWMESISLSGSDQYLLNPVKFCSGKKAQLKKLLIRLTLLKIYLVLNAFLLLVEVRFYSRIAS